MTREQNIELQSNLLPDDTTYARADGEVSTLDSATMAASNTAAITGNAAAINAAGTAEGDIVAALNNIAAKPCCCGGGQGKGALANYVFRDI